MYRRAAIYPETVRQHSPPAYHPHTCRLIVQHLPKALLLALLVGSPVMAQTYTWDQWRDVYLGPGRSQLMERCALGRSLNLKGLSYFDSRFIESRKADFLRQGLSEHFLAQSSGKAAAMAVACPEVR